LIKKTNFKCWAIIENFKNNGFITIQNLESLGISKNDTIKRYGNPIMMNVDITIADFREYDQSKIYDYKKSAINANDIKISVNEINTNAHVYCTDILLSERNELKFDTVEHYEDLSFSFEESIQFPQRQLEFEKLSDQEVLDLKQKTKHELALQDPAPVLDALGIEYKQNHNRYIFKLRNEERTASCNMFLDRSGEWKLKDFGSGLSGTVENVVMEITQMDYKNALDFCLTNTNCRNHLQERIDEISGKKHINHALLSEEIKESIEHRRQSNIEKQKQHDTSSRVISAKKINEFSLEARAYLASRGISAIPENFYEITGEFKTHDGKVLQNRGIGVLTGDQSKVDLNQLTEIGADIHFFQPITRKDGSVMKTQSFGSKDITYMPDNCETVAVFESKMDYAAAFDQGVLQFSDVIIANGVGNYKKIINLLSSNNYKNIHFLIRTIKPVKNF